MRIAKLFDPDSDEVMFEILVHFDAEEGFWGYGKLMQGMYGDYPTPN